MHIYIYIYTYIHIRITIIINIAIILYSPSFSWDCYIFLFVFSFPSCSSSSSFSSSPPPQPRRLRLRLRLWLRRLLDDSDSTNLHKEIPHICLFHCWRRRDRWDPLTVRWKSVRKIHGIDFSHSDLYEENHFELKNNCFSTLKSKHHLLTRMYKDSEPPTPRF